MQFEYEAADMSVSVAADMSQSYHWLTAEPDLGTAKPDLRTVAGNIDSSAF
jgi:hypothetical protein